jgi:1-deoxy-D-xylulose-5-phosphate reductoisomerase
LLACCFIWRAWDTEHQMRRTVTILGATGSIGRSTRAVIAENPQRLAVAAVVSGRNAAGLAQIARETGASFAAIADERQGGELAAALAGSGIAHGAGREAVLEAVSRDSDIVVSAISGAAGLEATFAALTPGRVVALANKESLVCAGAAVMARAGAVGARILPLDSEHNALFQVLGERADLGGPHDDADCLGWAVPDLVGRGDRRCHA